MRLYRPRELALALKWNLWIFFQAVLIGNPGLSPDQEGDRYVFAWRDWLSLFVLPMVPLLFYFSGFFPFVVWFFSPWLISATHELGGEKHPTGRVYRGPRVWLPRWYIGTLGVVWMFSGLPAWLRWLIVVLWALQAIQTANCYSSPLLFYQTIKNENPNRNCYSIAALPYLLLVAGKHYQAEEEFEEVLKLDPLNWKANFVLTQFRKNRSLTEAGIGFVAFRCHHCGLDASRLIRHGDRLTREEHEMYFLRVHLCTVSPGGSQEVSQVV